MGIHKNTKLPSWSHHLYVSKKNCLVFAKNTIRTDTKGCWKCVVLNPTNQNMHLGLFPNWRQPLFSFFRTPAWMQTRNPTHTNIPTICSFEIGHSHNQRLINPKTLVCTTQQGQSHWHHYPATTKKHPHRLSETKVERQAVTKLTNDEWETEHVQCQSQEGLKRWKLQVWKPEPWHTQKPMTQLHLQHPTNHQPTNPGRNFQLLQTWKFSTVIQNIVKTRFCSRNSLLSKLSKPSNETPALFFPSNQVVYQAGKTIALCKFTELMQWQIVYVTKWYKRELNWIDT